MYDQFLAKTFHTPDFGDQQFDVNNQNNNNNNSTVVGQVQRQPTERVRGMTPSSDSSNERQQTPSHRHTPVSTGMSPATETASLNALTNHHAPGYPANFFAAPLTQEQLYNARLTYSQHINYQQYKQQLMHQMGAYNPLEMLQQGYGMGASSAPPQMPPQVQQTVPEIVNEEKDDSAAQTQMYSGMKRPSPDNCFLNTQKKAKPQKKKKKKDPNEPQKPVSAYALFFRDTQAAIKGQNPNASFGEVSKIVASMWDTLDVEHKNVYKRKTEDAKKDYLKALAAYRASLVSKSGRETETNTTTYNSGYGAGPCYNGYSQHGYSPPTSVAGGGSDHHNTSQRVSHHHQGYSPPPGSMSAKPDHTATQHAPMHHHGYSQTPGGGVMSDSRGTQLGHHFTQSPGNQSAGLDHMTGSHRVSHHHHGYSPTTGPSQQESSHSKPPHSGYTSGPGGSTSGAFNDSHSGSQDRNSQLGTHYHGYSPPRSISSDVSHQLNAQYVSGGHGRIPGNTNTHQGYPNQGSSNVSESVQNSSQQNNSSYQESHQTGMRNVQHHHSGYPQLSNSASQADIRQSSGTQQAGGQGHHGYSPSPSGNAQPDTHQTGSQTGGYQSSNSAADGHHQIGTQSVNSAYTQASTNNEHQHHTNSQSTQYSSPTSGETHHQHASTQSGGYHSPNTAENHMQHHASTQNQYPPTSSSNDNLHQHHRMQQHHHQNYSQSQTTSYNGYSPRLSTSYDAFSPSTTSLPSPATQGQTLMNQDCIQNQQQQSQVLVGRHMAPPGGQHMTVHQPPPI